MNISFLAYITSVLYGLIFCLPIKIKINKKYGSHLSYKEMKKFGEQGDIEIIKLKKRTRLMLVILLSGVIFDFFIHLHH